jgi:hypothetical protein
MRSPAGAGREHPGPFCDTSAVGEDAWDWSQDVVDHVEVHAADYDDSVRFYATVLMPLGIPSWNEDSDSERLTCFTRLNVVEREPPTTGLHLCFVARSPEQVDAFHRAGVDAGYRSNGGPGYRAYSPGYYAAFLLDPGGNNTSRPSTVTSAIPAMWRRNRTPRHEA